MSATVNDLMKRYMQKEGKAIIDCTKAHLEEINESDDHAVFKGGQWSFDEEAVRMLDGYFKYVPPEPPVPQKQDPREVAVQKLTEENQALMQALDTLQNEFQSAKTDNEKLSQVIQGLQSSLLALQEGRDTASSQLIRRNAQRAERAEARADSLAKKFKELTDSSDKQIKDLQERIVDLQAQLKKATDNLKAKVESDYMRLEAENDRNRVYNALTETEKKISDVQSDFEEERAQKEDALTEINDLRLVISSAASHLDSVLASLHGALANSGKEESASSPGAGEGATAVSSPETPTDSKEDTNANDEPQGEDNAQPLTEEGTTPIPMSDFSKKIQEQREKEFEAVRKAQEEAKSGKKGGFFSRLRRIAGMF